MGILMTNILYHYFLYHLLKILLNNIKLLEKTEIKIHLAVEKNNVKFSTTNTIVHHENRIDKTNGFGIKNVKRRTLLYPDKYDLKMKQ